MPGFQKSHLAALLAAEPFRPFEIYTVRPKCDLRVEDPDGVSFDGDMLVIRDGDVEHWISLDAIVLISVEGPVSRDTKLDREIPTPGLIVPGLPVVGRRR
jgi:hypothetical protein